jgi:hypothetical protein
MPSPDPYFRITFASHDVALETITKGLDAYTDWVIELTYRSDVEPYTPNPVWLKATTSSGAIVVRELDENWAPLGSDREHTIPIEALMGVEII